MPHFPTHTHSAPDGMRQTNLLLFYDLHIRISVAGYIKRQGQRASQPLQLQQRKEWQGITAKMSVKELEAPFVNILSHLPEWARSGTLFNAL